LFLACFGMTKERVGEEEETPAPSLREMLRAVMGNAPLLNLSLFTVFFYIAYTVWMAIAIYFIKYIIGSEGYTATFFLIQSGPILSVPLFQKKR
jgi:GPH family glycoside/pentoside/hexuronide:cation symporter